MLKIPEISVLVTTAIFKTKICEAENKIPVVSDLVTSNVLDKKIAEVEHKIPNFTNFSQRDRLDPLNIKIIY